MTSKKVASSGCVLRNKFGKETKLTERQYTVLQLLSYPHSKTQDAIAIKFKTSRQNINKIVRRLKQLGLYDKKYNALEKNIGVAFSSVTTQPLSKFRFHNFRWTINIISKSDNFKVCQFTLDSNKVKVWENSIEIYSRQSFTSDTIEEAYTSSLEYWYKFFVKVQNRVNATILKDQVQNINLTKLELANTNNEIATEYIKEGNKLKIYDKEGKVWALIDNSFNLFEFETVNVRTVKPDMQRIQQVLNDYRDNPEVLTPKEMQKRLDFIIELMGNMAIIQSNTQKQLNEIIKKL